MNKLEKLLVGSQKANSILTLLLDDVDWLRSDEGLRSLYIVKHHDSAMVVIDDGNGVILATQAIEYTDFPLESIKLYGCWNEAFWILMLPGEY